MVLVALAFAAATRVSDSREGLIAEIITLLGGLAGVSLLIYGLAARRRPSSVLATSSPAPSRLTPRPSSRNDLLLGAGRIGLGIVLLGGLAISAGAEWAPCGLVLLRPLISRIAYVCER